MKQIRLLVMIFIWLLCTANQCCKDDCRKTINFVNNSSIEVYIYRSGFGKYGAPDTSFFKVARKNILYKTKPNETNIYALADRYCIERWFGEKYGGINVFVLDAEIVESVPLDTIDKYRKVLKTIYPSIEEMENSNWTITYTSE
jgi:hypothetical protein